MAELPGAVSSTAPTPSTEVSCERERLIQEFLDLNREMMREFHRGLPFEWLSTEVTMPQFKTLMVLYGMEQAPMGDLAEALGTGVSTVTGIVDRLVEHGLVAREEDRRDRRVVVGRPTSEGIALVDRLLGAARERMRQSVGRLTIDEIRLVHAAARLLCQSATAAFSPGEQRANGQRAH